ncbi:MAG TPA: HAMP domain-containing histidine kinase [Candidatus Onthovicinus excrementipullorum]|nr:HAMP domain-containing histidine kinase [Candidatus Onthovicinus excrementipullorum]
MKIKERIALSNILTVVIPAVVTVILLGIGVLVFYFVLFRGTNSEPIADWRREELQENVVQIVQEAFTQEDPLTSIGKVEKWQEQLKENDMLFCVFSDNAEVLRLGIEEVPGSGKLVEAVSALGGTGTTADNSYELLARRGEVAGNSYQVYLYTPRGSSLSHTMKIQILIFGILLLFLILAAVVISSRFLTRRVFRRIEKPIDLLSAGVHQIREGNLDIRIDYNEPDEFGPICAEFNEMAARLKISGELESRDRENRRALLADISHDLRSPLTSILAYVEGLEDGVADTPEKQRQYLSTIKAKTSDIDRLVKKLFLFSKMDMGDYPYFPEKLDAGREVADFVEASREDYEKAGLSVTLVSHPEHTMIYADPTYFRSVLTNLLDNSAKYKKDGTGHVRITMTTEGHLLRMLVDDDGPGVAQSDLGKLFDIFYRADPARKNPHKGSGLGLAIVAKIVDRMGGAIHAENLSQGGLRMAITLPVMEGETDHEKNFNH